MYVILMSWKRSAEGNEYFESASYANNEKERLGNEFRAALFELKALSHTCQWGQRSSKLETSA